MTQNIFPSNSLSELKPLLLVHGVLLFVPLAAFIIPNHILFLPLTWVLTTVPIAQLLCLALYVGMISERGSGLLPKAIGLVAAYVTVMTTGLAMFGRGPVGDLGDLFEEILYAIAMSLGLFLLLLGATMVARHLLGTVHRIPEPALENEGSRKQFSLLALLGVLSVFGVILGMTKVSRDAAQAGDDFDLRILMFMALFAFTYVINMLMAVWAVLSPGQMSFRFALVLCISVLLGFAIGMQSLPGGAGFGAMLTALTLGGMAAASLSSTLIVMLSLWFLRTLGFRLITRRSLVATPVEGEENADELQEHPLDS